MLISPVDRSGSKHRGPGVFRKGQMLKISSTQRSSRENMAWKMQAGIPTDLLQVPMHEKALLGIPAKIIIRWNKSWAFLGWFTWVSFLGIWLVPLQCMTVILNFLDVLEHGQNLSTFTAAHSLMGWGEIWRKARALMHWVRSGAKAVCTRKAKKGFIHYFPLAGRSSATGWTADVMAAWQVEYKGRKHEYCFSLLFSWSFYCRLQLSIVQSIAVVNAHQCPSCVPCQPLAQGRVR